MKIREIISKDEEATVKLISIADNRSKDVSRKKFEKCLKKNNMAMFVAEEGNKLIGYLVIKELEKENKETEEIVGDKIINFAHINWIAVHPDFRGRKIASFLLKYSETWAKKKQKIGIWLDCNKRVINLYIKNKYVFIGNYNYKGKIRNIM